MDMMLPPLTLSRCLVLVRGGPAPSAGAVTAPDRAFPVDVGNDLAVARQQRLGRAHLGAERQLALGQTVGAVFGILRGRHVVLGSAGAEGAFVHLAPAAEVADLRVLRRSERAGVEAVTAADAKVL